MVVSPQSFGDLLVPHPHAHSVVSLGLFSRDGVFHRMEDVDFTPLEEIFRDRFFERMVKRGKITQEIVEDMRRWPHSGFHLNWERKIEAEDRKELEGLLDYMERAPVSLRRLTYQDDGMVHYQGTKYHPRLGTDHQLLPALEFLAMLVPHVMLRYEVTIRSYGAASTTFRKKVGWIDDPPVKEPPPESIPVTELLPELEPSHPPPGGQPSDQRPDTGSSLEKEDGEEDEFLRTRRRNWAKLIAKVWLVDPTLCATCGKPMKIVSAISSPHHDDVIEGILRHLNRWDPPWKRVQKARGPPTSSKSHPSPGAGSEMIDPLLDVDQYLVDPPPDDD